LVSGFSVPFVSELIGLLYDAATDSAGDGQGWQRFLATVIPPGTPARASLFVHGDQPCETVVASHNWDPRALALYGGYYGTISPILKAARHEGRVGRVRGGLQLVSPESVLRSEFYNDFLRPWGMGFGGTAVALERTAERMAAFSIVRDDGEQGWRAEDVALVQLLVPHLQRAVTVSGLLARARAATNAAGRALDHLAIVGIVVDQAGRVLQANLAGERLLRAADALGRARDGTLRAIDEATTASLLAAIAAAAITDKRTLPSRQGRVRLPRGAARAPLEALLVPLPEPDTRDGTRSGSVLLLISDRRQARPAPATWLAQRFGLTRAEQRIAAALIEGKRLAEAAAALGITTGTARTHLKRILTKTHCNRQAELIRLALTAPGLRADD
jgi:DNA-binding CsgD family transcriptional regulator